MEITWTCKDTLTPNARYTHDCKYNLGQECETFIGGLSSIKPLREETSMCPSGDCALCVHSTVLSDSGEPFKSLSKSHRDQRAAAAESITTRRTRGVKVGRTPTDAVACFIPFYLLISHLFRPATGHLQNPPVTLGESRGQRGAVALLLELSLCWGALCAVMQ